MTNLNALVWVIVMFLVVGSVGWIVESIIENRQKKKKEGREAFKKMIIKAEMYYPVNRR